MKREQRKQSLVSILLLRSDESQRVRRCILHFDASDDAFAQERFQRNGELDMRLLTVAGYLFRATDCSTVIGEIKAYLDVPFHLCC